MKMIGKLLIVDDQAIFRQGIAKMIGEHELGWQVAGEAENGREAVEQIAALQPHLILTDIRMPHMDGLELAEYVHRHHKETAVIILTGYEDFKYAQAALKFGAIDFLLKPCNEQTLIEVLGRAYEHFREGMLRAQRQAADRRALEEHVVRSLLLGLPCDDRLAQRAGAAYAGKELVLLRVESYFPPGKAYRRADLGLLQFALFNMITELAECPPYHGRLVSVRHDRFALFTELVEEEPARGLEQRIAEACRTYLGLAVTAHRCGPAGEPEGWSGLYRGAEEQRAVPAAEPPAPRLPAANVTRIREMQTELETRLVLGQMAQVKEQIEAMLGRLPSMPPEDARIETLSFVMALGRTVSRLFGGEEARFDVAVPIESLPALADTGAIVAFAQERAERFLAQFAAWQEDKNRNLVTKTMAYVEEHYMESCSLAEVAEKLHMSGTYFSKVFKRETGDTFTNYVTKVRMEKAKLLLSNTDMKIFEVAAAVGYDDPNYFTNVFRTTQKISPTEFRKRHR
ncbi:response regulator transcription factor [Paenibacillus caseinilyticus]|uniref:AraC family transcriptional regulator n=3 Tax=Paenibacillus mucilaginosus TaxID=61624 RepID=I0BAI2_9BACL|nr:response regulator [Paenibacillus mucilaginosus]AFH59379.1 AraC family transcriptional regulator [Paenibacillus mucilaginosus K02]WFA16158.1 response regulator [Paenibacillus mucilaginosus]